MANPKDISKEALALIEKARWAKDGSDESDEATIASLSLQLVNSVPALLSALQNDSEGAASVIKLLSNAGRQDAVHALLANLNISRDDSNLLEIAIEIGLKGDPVTRHRWIIDDDVAQQRIEMIENVVLPHVYSTAPEKIIFIALKKYEAAMLLGNRPVMDATAIHRLIEMTRRASLSDGQIASTPVVGICRNSIRIAFQDEVFKTLLRLAWSAQEYLLDLHERHEPEEFVSVLAQLENIIPVCLMPTHLGYPMGGGESFIHQSCRVLNEFAVRCVWMSFQDPHTGWYTADSFTTTPYYIDIRRAGGCTKEAVLLAVEKFRPNLIHAHGGTADMCMEIAKEHRITSMIGYHFWHGLIDLGETKNRHILENVAQHRLNASTSQISPLIFKYVASEFMLEVHAKLGGTYGLNVIHPLSDGAQYAVEREDIGSYVLQVNTCVLKGGSIFLDCVKALGDRIPFMGIQSEPEDPAFNESLVAQVNERPLCQLRQYGNVRDFYRSARIVIVPTLVDETFCRVAFEAAMNGIPVISTSNGFLKQMLGETGIFLPETSPEWIACIESLYADSDRLKEIGTRQQARLRKIFGDDSARFAQAAMNLIDHSSVRNIGIFTVWGDQGIGNLSHTHAKVLRKIGYRVHIFSAQPYAAMGQALVRQANPEDWTSPENADSVHYSFNHREAVTVHELTQFILSNNIHTLIVPEVCWQTNWDRLLSLQVNGLSICSIPMIEIVIKEEIPNHNLLTSTFYCTRSAEEVLNAAGIDNGAFLGYGFGAPLSQSRMLEKHRRLARRPKIHYLHVAGHNPQTRKNTPQVIEAFTEALKIRDDIQLTVTSMDPIETYYSQDLPAGINIIDKSLSRQEIHELYENHDVSIQVSSHEGLGLGFYESISHSTPILSLDAKPHNEIVIEGKTGWLIPSSPMPIPDNTRAVVEAWRFNTSDLTSKIVLLEKEEIDEVITTTALIFKSRFDETALIGRFIQALPRPAPPETLIQFIGSTNRESDCKEISMEEPLAASPVVATETETPLDVAPAVAPGQLGWKPRIKRMLRRSVRGAYQIVKPATRIIAGKLRQLMIEATTDIRSEVHDLRREVERVNDENHRLSHELTSTLLSSIGPAQRQPTAESATSEFSLQLLTITRSISKLDNRTSKYLQSEQSRNSSIDRISRDLEFLKRRMTTYAGNEAVLTYLRDETPIFVNTGDLGCPSPIVDGGVWEPENLSVLYSLLTPDTVFLDIGANIGYFSIAIGNRLKRGGQVLAFEPHATLTNLIERSIQLNSLEAVVKIFRCAVSDREGTLELFYPDDHLGKGSSVRNLDEQGKMLVVEAHRVDALVDRSLEVDLIKIDVEGHEMAVLQGMTEIFKRSPKAKVLFEKLESGTRETEGIGNFMLERGLNLYGIGAHAILKPLSRSDYTGWIGDVLAAPIGAITHLERTSFSVYPGNLDGAAQIDGTSARYTAKKRDDILFFGPDWYLQKGAWRVRLQGTVRGEVRLMIFEEHETPLAEFLLSGVDPEGAFTVTRDVSRFEMRAYANTGTFVELEKVEFYRG